jgi:hypothetical protein
VSYIRRAVQIGELPLNNGLAVLDFYNCYVCCLSDSY